MARNRRRRRPAHSPPARPHGVAQAGRTRLDRAGRLWLVVLALAILGSSVLGIVNAMRRVRAHIAHHYREGRDSATMNR
jgi:hypothetical protein